MHRKLGLGKIRKLFLLTPENRFCSTIFYGGVLLNSFLSVKLCVLFFR
jgi:hypothetical protein